MLYLILKIQKGVIVFFFENYNYGSFIEKNRTKLLNLGRLLAFITLPFLCYFIYQDLFLINAEELYTLRFIPIGYSILFIIFSYTRYSKKYKNVLFFHSLILIGYYLMISAIITIILIDYRGQSYYLNSGIDGLFAVNFILFVFSGDNKYYPYILTIPFVVFVADIILFEIPIKSTISLINPMVTIPFFILASVYKMNLNKRNFNLFKKNIKQKNELHFKNEKLKKLNSLLNKQIKKRAKTEKKLKKQVVKDDLSNLLNRRGIFNALKNIHKNVKRNKNSFFSCLVDIDNLKKINDNYGHIEGDYVIRIIGKIIKNSLRENDYAGRVGGDEFLFFINDEKSKDIFKIIYRIKENLKIENENNNKDYNISFSYGILRYDSDLYDDIDEYFNEIDKKMYKNKKQKDFNSVTKD